MKLLCVVLFFYINLAFVECNVLHRLSYELKPEKIEPDLNPEFISNFSLVTFKDETGINFINMSFNVIKDYPNDIKVKISILFKQKDGSYALYGRTLEHKLCDYINNDKLFFPSVLKHSNYDKKCPVTAKYYHLTNYRVPFENLPPIVQTGPLKGIVELSSPTVRIFTITIYGVIEPMD